MPLFFCEGACLSYFSSMAGFRRQRVLMVAREADFKSHLFRSACIRNLTRFSLPAKLARSVLAPPLRFAETMLAGLRNAFANARLAPL